MPKCLYSSLPGTRKQPAWTKCTGAETKPCPCCGTICLRPPLRQQPVYHQNISCDCCSKSQKLGPCHNPECQCCCKEQPEFYYQLTRNEKEPTVSCKSTQWSDGTLNIPYENNLLNPFQVCRIDHPFCLTNPFNTCSVACQNQENLIRHLNSPIPCVRNDEHCPHCNRSNTIPVCPYCAKPTCPCPYCVKPTCQCPYCVKPICPCQYYGKLPWPHCEKRSLCYCNCFSCGNKQQPIKPILSDKSVICKPERSVVIIGGKLVNRCDCSRRNGLQDECTKIDCDGLCKHITARKCASICY